MRVLPELADSMTIMHARGRRLAKLVGRDSSLSGYDSAFLYDAATLHLDGLPDLWAALHHLLPLHDRCVVRGKLINGVTARGVRRLAHRCPNTDDQPTLFEAPRHWLALDADSIPLPDDMRKADLLACAAVAMDALPPSFRQATAIVQATASHGIKPGARLRLWFWCDRPIGGEEAKRWLSGRPFDPSVFRTVQPIYTAAPLFAAGLKDHLPHRLAKWSGNGLLTAPSAAELAPKPRPQPAFVRPAPRAGSARMTLYLNAVLRNAQDRIRTASHRHPTILQEARSLMRFVESGLLSEGELSRVLWDAAQDAGKDDLQEFARILAFARAHSVAPELLTECRND